MLCLAWMSLFQRKPLFSDKFQHRGGLSTTQHLGRYSLHLLQLKSSMVQIIEVQNGHFQVNICVLSERHRLLLYVRSRRCHKPWSSLVEGDGDCIDYTLG